MSSRGLRVCIADIGAGPFGEGLDGLRRWLRPQLDESAVLLGHSWGAMFAATVAAECRVRKLILLCPPSPPGSRARLVNVRAALADTREQSGSWLRAAILNGGRTTEVTGPMGADATTGIRLDVWRRLRGESLDWSVLPAVTQHVPTYWVQVSDDPLSAPPPELEMSVVSTTGGHFPYLTQAERTCRLLAEICLSD